MNKVILSLSFFLVCCCITTRAQEKVASSNFSLTYYSTNELGFSFLKKQTFYGELRVRQNKNTVTRASISQSYSYGDGGEERSIYSVDKKSGYYYKDLYYSFILKNDLSVYPEKNICFTWGIGYDYSNRYDDFLIVPVGLTAKKLFNTHWLEANISLEARSEFDSTKKLEFEPKLGFSINF